MSWLRKYFLVGEIFFNLCFLWSSFLIGVLLIRVKHETQDVSLYKHAWRPSKVMSDLSKVYMPPSASCFIIQGTVVIFGVEP